MRKYENLDLDVLLSGSPELNNEKNMEIFTCVQEYFMRVDFLPTSGKYLHDRTCMNI